MSIYGLAELVKSNPSTCQPLFVDGHLKEQLAPDAKYVFSKMSPQYSAMGSARRHIEERVMDHFQHCLNLFEDTYCGPRCSRGYNDDIIDSAFEQGGETFENPDLTVAGVTGWSTGQRHRPVNNQKLSVTVYFNHDCLKHDPSHKICFPTVGASHQRGYHKVLVLSRYYHWRKIEEKTTI